MAILLTVAASRLTTNAAAVAAAMTPTTTAEVLAFAKALDVLGKRQDLAQPVVHLANDVNNLIG